MRDDITIGEWLREEWLPALAVGTLRPKTLESYESHGRIHLAPRALGAMRLQDLSRERIAKHYAMLRTERPSTGP